MKYFEIAVKILESLVETRESATTETVMRDYGISADDANGILQYLIDNNAVIDSSSLAEKVVLFNMDTTRSYLDSLR